ncbi:uncharacterized protein SPPG_07101 [Spizellomyces punctatus DAOM BR117]|uniref:Uncharacterized protein n=1 Tax=Spizellomyces punctatus (strain DAOM BR117) TaxID=645134 RepID=A0A0L0H8X1_SPIPD|nr:uncharacterized protein SPPG_07101 [Spizellomyces punctatus DAOM BR117]KNC97632.1 hypothetical protein SPPG_07101 [Spizellomyces punctatus DAOM BR117]|eukprot:XP_016605672.1 hypothetical protein SPPG_07101 [Spizellomyces punctatus DAOM BR117]
MSDPLLGLALYLHKLAIANVTTSLLLNVLNIVTYISLFETRWTKMSSTIMFQIIGNIVHTVLFYISVFEVNNMNYAWVIFDGIGYIVMANACVWMLRDRYKVFAVSSNYVEKVMIGLGILHLGIITADVMVFGSSFYLPLDWDLVNKVGIFTKLLTFAIEIYIDLNMFHVIRRNASLSKSQINDLLRYIIFIIMLSVGELCYAKLVHFSFDVLSKCPIYAFKTLFVLRLFDNIKKDKLRSKNGTRKDYVSEVSSGREQSVTSAAAGRDRKPSQTQPPQMV